MEKQIIENNRLIADFMGWKKHPKSHYECIMKNGRRLLPPFAMQFNSSWDWLMPVVEKCFQIGYRDQDEDNDIYNKWSECFDDRGIFVGNHIDEAWKACVEFIKWLNNQNIKSLHELDTYIANDQPQTCPKCGVRTEFIEIAEDKQQHKCPGCQYEFFLDFEDE